MELDLHIPKRIAEIRAIAKVSQTELARRMDISSSLISHWELGTRNPSQEQLQEIARHLGVSLDYLLKANKQPAFQYRAKPETEGPAAVAKLQLDASVQIDSIDEIFRLAKQPIPQFLHRADFTYEHVKQLAEQMRDIFRLHRRISLPALKQAMAEQGIFVFEWDLPDNICGMSYRGSVSAVFINHLHQPTRKLFTLAHELAHLLFHLGRNKDENGLVSFLGNSQDPDEKEANAFASELLMPLDDISALVDLHGDLMLDVGFMEAIAQSFNVSRDAIFYRLCKLNLCDWKRDFARYASPFKKAEPGKHRVTDVSGQVSPFLIAAALVARHRCGASDHKVSEWFLAGEQTLAAYLPKLIVVHAPTSD